MRRDPVFFPPAHPIMSHNIPPTYVPTQAWVAFRARLAHYLGQQHRLLVAANDPRKPFDLTTTHGVAGLPLEFPNDAFQHSGYIDFTEGKVRYVFQYTFFHALPVQAWEPLVWKISARPYISVAPWKDVGYVEFDSRVYLDINPIVPLVDGEVMLRFMVNSVEKGRGVRVASRVEAPLGPGGTPGLWNIETLEARSTTTERENLVVELGKRYVPKRSCSVATCRAWLPAAGPDVCVIHLLGH
ncbi:hypothetical protein B0H16DRAFT_692602 [Mycena metata]|uniref:Uncharacterized protein n=1 Tax=Mycena metata TaxID=1033252 RepID=A0AAD7GUQ0_9AGAR|nr:hypothetical protein B0H16DRAFT_692602 [Mycena metata]